MTKLALRLGLDRRVIFKMHYRIQVRLRMIRDAAMGLG